MNPMSASDRKKLFVKTYGCQMNVYDSERMVEALGTSGYDEVSSPEEADMIPAIFAKKRPKKSIPSWAALRA